MIIKNICQEPCEKQKTTLFDNPANRNHVISEVLIETGHFRARSIFLKERIVGGDRKILTCEKKTKGFS